MQFTIIFFCDRKRQTQHAGKGKETAGPEVPERAQQRGEKREAEHRAEKGGKEHVEPQLAPADAQGEGEEGEREGETVERIEQIGQGAARAAAQPDGAQRVIEEGEARAEEQRAPERGGLCRNVDAHALSPRTAG